MRDDELKHYGVKGMKWGVRRYQNADGSLNEEGQKRYGTQQGSIKGTGHRLLAKNYDIAAKVYRKLGNKSLGSIMAYQRTKSYKKAREADIAAREKLEKLDKKATKVIGGGKTAKQKGEKLADRAWNKEARSKSATTRMHNRYKKNLNGLSKRFAKIGLKRAGIATAVGIGGGYALTRMGHKTAGRILARLSGAYAAHELRRSAKAILGAQILGRGYLGADSAVQNHRRKKQQKGKE